MLSQTSCRENFMTALSTLYEQNFSLWLNNHIQLLKEAKFNELDLDHLIDELESMGKRDKRELVSRFIILIAHLLKWQYQTDKQSTSWRSSIIEQRKKIAYLLKNEPGLKPYILEAIENAYPEAVDLAAEETELPLSVFPSICPYSKEQLLEKFYPTTELLH
jgi:hypothetical protein